MESEYLEGIKISTYNPCISHIFFANDMLIFLKPTQQNCWNMVQILQSNCTASRQHISLQKSGIFFGANMPCDLGSELAGLGRSKCHALAYVKGRILGKLQGWKQNLLAPVGKEVLIKAMAQAILTYPMNIFKVMVSICKDLNFMLTHFRWG
ncbi:hypothetical protein ACFX13_013551 [Malus domestica]